MIGCDIVDMSRFKQRQERWARRVLTEKEQEEYTKRTDKLEYLAGRWAVKEAIYKASGLLSGFDVLTAANGKPIVCGIDGVYVSISHEKTHVFAIALVK